MTRHATYVAQRRAPLTRDAMCIAQSREAAVASQGAVGSPPASGEAVRGLWDGGDAERARELERKVLAGLGDGGRSTP